MFPVSLLCIGHSLRLLADAEFDEEYATEIQLNEIYDALENAFTFFEADGVSANAADSQQFTCT